MQRISQVVLAVWVVQYLVSYISRQIGENGSFSTMKFTERVLSDVQQHIVSSVTIEYKPCSQEY